MNKDGLYWFAIIVCLLCIVFLAGCLVHVCKGGIAAEPEEEFDIPVFDKSDQTAVFGNGSVVELEDLAQYGIAAPRYYDWGED